MKILLLFLIFSLFVSCADDGVSGLGGSPKKIFVTAAGTNANIGGVSGADTKCATDTNNPGDGEYKALIVQGTTRRACTSANCATGGASEHIDWVLAPNTEYRRASDDALIGKTDANGLFIFPFSNPTDATYNYWLWTGFGFTDWVAYTNNCGNWTDPASGLAGIGFGDRVNKTAIFGSTGSCPTTGRLICVEQ